MDQCGNGNQILGKSWWPTRLGSLAWKAAPPHLMPEMTQNLSDTSISNAANQPSGR